MNIKPRPLKDGRPAWRLVWNAAKDPATGKPRRIIETFRGTKREAERYWIAKQAKIDAQGRGYVEPTKDTLADYLQRWLCDYVQPNLKPTTYESYAELVEVHIAPGLGAVALRDLTAADVSVWQADMLRKKTPPTKKAPEGHPLSPRRVGYARAVLHAALEEAVRLGLLATNPVDRVKAPRQDPKEVKSFDPSQVQRLQEAVKGHRLEPVLALAWQTGLRTGELLGLTWADVDLDAATLRVRHNLVDLGQGRRVVQDPKRERSIRTVALTADAVAVLKGHRAKQAEERWQAGERWQGDFVFCTKQGKPLMPGNVRRDFYGVLDRAGLPRQGFHGLRHTNATLAKMAGVDIGEIAANLGHTSPAFTAKTYAHVLPETQRAAAERFAAFVGERVTGETAPVKHQKSTKRTSRRGKTAK